MIRLLCEWKVEMAWLPREGRRGRQREVGNGIMRLFLGI